MGLVARRTALTLYALLTCLTAARHEPWADEAQAWLIARDSPLPLIWTRLLHYEGTPGLWHTALWCATRLHLPYTSLSYLSAAFGIAAAYLVFRYSPFPAPLRLLLPFTYFLAYQYAVVARSYVLIPPLLFGLAAIHRHRKPWLQALLLAALALTSIHGLVISLSVALFVIRPWSRPLSLYVLAAAAALWSAWPAADVLFIRHWNWSLPHVAQTATRALSEAFTLNWVTASLLLLASFPFLARGGALLPFLAASVSLIAFAAVVYGNVWHFGLLALVWFFSIWIAAARVKPGWLALSALTGVIAIHLFWTGAALVREWRTAYSGGREAALYLQSHQIPEAGLYGLGYASVAVQPYFDRNIFLNFGHGYWDWSSANRMIENYPRLSETRPPWVLVGYKTAAENHLWNSLVRRAGYSKVRHFEGNLIWEDTALEPESFDLYRRP